jgi:putative FmdB family regulatory protein
MPIYEFVCEECSRRQSLLVLSGRECTIECKFCGSDRLKRLVSRVKVVMSEESRLERLADPSKWGDVNEEDPKSVAKMMKKMGSELGEDLGDEFHEMVDELESGKLPEEVNNDHD